MAWPRFLIVALACLGLMLVAGLAPAQQIDSNTYASAQDDGWRPSPGEPVVVADQAGVKHMNCASGNCSTGMGAMPARQPMYAQRAAEWPVARPAAPQPVQVASKPAKDCNCTDAGNCKCDPGKQCKCEPEKIAAALVSIGDRLQAFEIAINDIKDRPEPEPVNVEQLADAIQERLTLPVRIVDDNGKQIGDVVSVPLNNKTPLSLRLKQIAQR